MDISGTDPSYVFPADKWIKREPRSLYMNMTEKLSRHCFLTLVKAKLPALEIISSLGAKCLMIRKS